MDTHKSTATSVNAGFAAGWRQLNRTLLTLAEDYVGWLDALWLERLNASAGHKPELSIGILLWPGFPLMSLTGIVESLRHAADFGDQSRPLCCRWSIMGSSVTSEQAAEMVSLSARQFSRLFRESVGVTPKRYILDTRLRYARFLVENSSMAMTAIAFETGFADCAHFSTTFRARFGVAPRDARAGRAA